MTAIQAIRRDTRICMFDLYGTVVDMQRGLTEAVTPYLKNKGWSGRPDALVTWWRRTHFENSMIDALLHHEHTPYREIGRRALDYTLERAGIEHTDDEVRDLVAKIESLKPFPDVVAPYLIMLTAFVAQAILAEASLSFLGLGVTEPTASWGLMLSGAAADFYQQAPWMIVFPGIAISLAVFAFNLFGDSLRDWLDPKIKV